MSQELSLLHHQLVEHQVYKKLNSVENIKKFMQVHVFAVYDFMSLLKSLQRDLTCVSIPWKPAPYGAEIGRFINEIVVGEETDLDHNGVACSHFELYVRAMQEVGADISGVLSFVEINEYSKLSPAVAEFVKYNLDLASSGKTVEVASAFFWGREKLIPEIFEKTVNVLESENANCPRLLYYLKRHIELDGDEHGPLARKLLDRLMIDDESKELAHEAAKRSLELRLQLWDHAANLMS